MEIPDWFSEKQIELVILNFLKSRNIFCWKIDQVGFYDSKRGIYRKPSNPHRLLGVPDICGIYRSCPLFIEVKKSTGRLSPEQKVFLEKARSEGAIAFVARNLDDVKKNLGID